MLSIPLGPPSDDNSASLRANYRPRAESPPPLGTLPAIQQPPQTHRQRQQRDEERKQHNARSPLAQLSQSENSIEHHKSQIRNWGSSWIRPPGVTKTLQAMNEEAQEREEQAELERQEANVRDMQAQQQLQDAQQQAQDTTQLDVEQERDLDGEIPDASEDITFNEDSMVEGSQLDATEEDLIDDAEQEEAELTGAARDEEDLGMDVDLDAEVERNLDDSIPEAGSYQHTDTEVEDSDSESELLQDSPARGRSVSQFANTPVDMTNMHEPPQVADFQQRMRAQVGATDSLPRSPGSLNLSSSILDSSLVGSSPVVQRGNARGRGGRSRRGRLS
ncbi:hypothetical protein M409DRAFT_70162 [Zasmidium cellare ATCC 36951]|uniref:Apc15p protein n=1 Tax=Zasmidium cellare ATCC 36951 TaxID=1080233 RepID=A0A6A6C3T9_ZASCE|nr:uncharacterized protein M409DRAFT_70162 [Zasmidium cellare ATCC 36951]KAF2160850.1 hypothetical protein M409DRAFT_70162 [Zasmidium cellare ATCC 36951]